MDSLTCTHTPKGPSFDARIHIPPLADEDGPSTYTTDSVRPLRPTALRIRQSRKRNGMSAESTPVKPADGRSGVAEMKTGTEIPFPTRIRLSGDDLEVAVVHRDEKLNKHLDLSTDEVDDICPLHVDEEHQQRSETVPRTGERAWHSNATVWRDHRRKTPARQGSLDRYGSAICRPFFRRQARR